MTLADEVGPSPTTGGSGVDARLESVALAARDRVPGVDHVSVFQVDRGGFVRTRAATSELARELDFLQHRLGEGPLFGLADARVVEVPHLGREQRWPGYVPAAAAAGLRAQVVIRVSVDGPGTVAGLNLYFMRSCDLHPDVGPVAELFAGQAAAVLDSAPGSHSLTEVLRTREVVAQATGIIADRYQMTQDRAFAFLVRAASHSNMPLLEVAQELVDRSNGTTSLREA